jgi:hypothetical protein
MGDPTKLNVELDRLSGLGPVLQGLAGEAAGLRTGPAAGPYMSAPGGMEPAVLEASSIAHDLVDTVLVSSVKNRLSETGQIMVDVANEYRKADQAKTDLSVVATTYTNATGDWTVPGMPK